MQNTIPTSFFLRNSGSNRRIHLGGIKKRKTGWGVVPLGEGCLESLFLRSVAVSFAERLTGDVVELLERHHAPYFGGSPEG